MNTRQQLNLLLSEKLIVQKTLGDVDKLLTKIRVLYGETYDKYGITIDSLKYYLFLEYLARIIDNNIECIVAEGDLHSVINPSVTEKNYLLQVGKERVGQIGRIFERLGIVHVNVNLMSESFGEKMIIDMVSKVSKLVKESTDLQNLLIPTVLKNRVAQERESGFRYAAEAIGLALNFDLKVGPPREENYDKVAQIIGKEVAEEYKAIYLRPSYPFTKDFSFYLTHPEVEEYGLTPYKAGSNKLQDQRIVIGVTSEEMIGDLIASAYVPQDIVYANPLVDLASMVAMNEQIRQDKIDVFELGKRIKILIQDREQLTIKILELLREVV